MKKLLLILLLAVSFVNAQNIIVSSNNSTTTALDSAATYTGTAEMKPNYSYLTIVVKSNVSSASNGVIVKMGATASALNTNQFFTYTVNDSSTNRFTVHLTGKYFKVMYINGTTAQTTFDLKTYMHMEEVLPVDANGNIKVNISGSAGASLSNIEADTDSTVDMVTLMNTSLDNIEADADSTVDKVTTMDTSLNNIEADADSTVDMVTAIHADVDGLQISADTSNARLQEIKLDAETLKNNSTTQLGYTHPSNISLASSSTVSTEVDTTTITATTWFSFSVFAVDDTLQIALKGDFSDAITVYPFSVGNFINQDPVTFPKAYIRRNTGGAGTVTYQSKVSGY